MTASSKVRIIAAVLLPTVAFVAGRSVPRKPTVAPPDLDRPSAEDVPAIEFTFAAPPIDEHLPQLASTPASEWPKLTENVLFELAPKTPAVAAPLIAQLSDSHRPRPTLELAAHWATTDPAATLAWIDTLPVDDLSWNARRVALCAWSSVDPRAALAHFESLSAKEQRSLIDESLDNLSTQALGRAAERKQPFSGLTFAHEILRGLNATDAMPILTLMDTAENQSLRDLAQRERAEDLYEHDPEAAIAIGGSSFLSRLAQTDPAQALELADERSRHVVIGEWAKTDTEAALTAAKELEGESRWTSIDRWRQMVSVTDPRRAAASYTSGIDQNLNRQVIRGDTLRRVLERYLTIDPDAAIQWAASLELARDRSTAQQEIQGHWRNQGHRDIEERLREHRFIE